MSQRDLKLLRLRDTLEHLRSYQKELEWAGDSPAVDVITETMLRDLECCRRLCEDLRLCGQLRHAV